MKATSAGRSAKRSLRGSAAGQPVSGPSSQVPGLAVAGTAEAAIVAYFIDAAALLGVPKSVAMIYGVCFASPVPLSFAEIQARLDLSTGSVSQGLRVLREVGALRVVAHASGRSVDRLSGGAVADQLVNGSTDLLARAIRGQARASATRYAPDLELRKLVQHFLDKRVGPQLASGQARLAAILGSLDSTSPVHQRLTHLANWHAKADAVLPLARAFLKVD